MGFDDGFLVVLGERVDEDKADAGWIRQECPTGKCAGACRHPENANGSDITATYADGVLELPVPERERPTRHGWGRSTECWPHPGAAAQRRPRLAPGTFRQ